MTAQLHTATGRDEVVAAVTAIIEAAGSPAEVRRAAEGITDLILTGRDVDCPVCGHRSGGDR